MNALEALSATIEGEFADRMNMYRAQSIAMLLAGQTADAAILAHKAEAFREASAALRIIVKKFKDPEDN